MNLSNFDACVVLVSIVSYTYFGLTFGASVPFTEQVESRMSAATCRSTRV